ncbi:MAG: hypothetical protein JXR45_07040, partial [Deltaproteobacteria bacterium]|nr:hypothetical protein [Deltaproteobacteria bacterium]
GAIKTTSPLPPFQGGIYAAAKRTSKNVMNLQDYPPLRYGLSCETRAARESGQAQRGVPKGSKTVVTYH